MIKIVVPTMLKSKPTGKIGKNKNLYQNTVEYTKFKRESLNYIEKQWDPSDCLSHCEGLMIVGFLPKPRTRPKDLGQLSGAIYDILTTAKVWRDDNLGVFTRSISYYHFDNYLQGYVCYLAENDGDWQGCLGEPGIIKTETRCKLEDYTFSMI